MKKSLIVAAMATAGLSACGGGGSGGSTTPGSSQVNGLMLPATMSVVTASDDTGSSARVSLAQMVDDPSRKLVALSEFPTSADINTDEARTYVWDESMQSLSIVNEILCYMEQTAASEMVNEGSYIALIDEEKCKQGQNQSSAGSTGQSSGGQATEYNKWTVVSTRADNDSPQTVNIWVPGETNGADPRDSQTILVEMTATEGMSSTKPFGSFALNFKGVVDGGLFGGNAGEEMVVMKGTLRTVDNDQGQPQFQFVDVSGQAANPLLTDFSSNEAVNVVLDDADGSGGVAKTEASHTFDDGGGPMTDDFSYVIAFDENNFLRGKDDNEDDLVDQQACTSRTSFDTQVWRYNLYHRSSGTFNGRQITAGQRVALNSGFPFIYNNKHGHIGYWGIWIEDDISVPDGATITQIDYGSDETSEHTLNIAPGKLVRRTANEEALTSFQGDEFFFWGEHPNSPGQFAQFVVTVNGSNEFILTESLEWGESGPMREDVTDANLTPTTEGENLWLWSDALGGNIVYVHHTATPANARTVTFYGEEFVQPNDDTLLGSSTSVAVKCHERCLKGGLTQGNVNAASSADDLYHNPNSAPYDYQVVVTGGKLLLQDHLGHTVSADGLNLETLGHEWGINTGEMVTADVAATLSNPWEIYDPEIVQDSYRWETGSNDWNKLVTVMDASGGYTTFDRPLSLNYTHSTANDANGDDAHNGSRFLLQYGGPGELWGFPWIQDGDRWYAAFTLADGTELTDGTNTFVVKAVEKEQSMQAVALSECGALDVDGLFSLPLPTETDIGEVSITLADKPTVTNAPRVIAGEAQ